MISIKVKEYQSQKKRKECFPIENSMEFKKESKKIKLVTNPIVNDQIK